ncbi:glycosyltransferase [Hydrogenovibrio halophilus]|uniref:glycosyltransferase n=1 Tax=Hydrogenovibrio halophilus TaxID=373391 RepID=UPI00037B7DE8|nr:glycosyltransferase [Hydrogenovibrio halophilus]
MHLAPHPKPAHPDPEFGRIVIVHDWLTAKGGAEFVLQTLLEMFPEADLVTLVDTLPDRDRHWLGNTPVYHYNHWLTRHFAKRYRWFLPLMPRWIENIDLSDYDLIISSSHTVAKGVIAHPHQTHLAYIYSPMRHAWDLSFAHFRDGSFGKGLKAWLIRRWLHRFRIWDSVSFMRPDKVIATSHFIRKRLQHVANLTTPVVYPPVPKREPVATPAPMLNYYLIVSRLVPYKSIDRIIAAFNKMPDKTLIVIGSGPQTESLKNLAQPNTHFLGYLEDDEVTRWMQYAKAFVHMATEDFGIAPLEAQSLGTPVIGYAHGALSETIRDLDCHESPSGVLFHSQTPQALQQAVQKFETQSQITQDACKANAERFSQARFKAQFRQQLTQQGRSPKC